MYVLVTGGTATEITLDGVRQLHPDISFPAGVIPDSLLAQFNVFPADEGDLPAFNPGTHKVVPDGFVQVAGVWTRQYDVVPLSAQEQLLKIQDKLDQLAADRFELETSGYVWTDANGASWWFSTTLEAQSKIEANRRTAESGLRPDNGVWKCGAIDGQGNITVAFRPTSNAEIQAIGMAIHTFVQKCYTAEGLAAAKVMAGNLSVTFQSEFDNL